ALGALAGLSGVDRPPGETSRPFDRGRDGMVLGEGGRVIVIERESIAKKRGARIFAYITSMGASNNHLGMVESSRITQEIAIRASFKDLPYGPDKVELIECHATGTRQGDVEEVRALQAVYGGGARAVLTSFKSQIGHTLGSSGINGLIHGIMAMKAGIYPPTLNCKHPDPEIGLAGSGFSILPAPGLWNRVNGDPRRMQVNAFGFGGSNYVVQLEEEPEGTATILTAIPEMVPTETPGADPPRGIAYLRTEIGSRTYRAAVAAASREEAVQLLTETKILDSGVPASGRLRALARQGIFLAPEDQAPKTAFVFPGQGSHYAGMGRELYQTFPIIKEWMDRAAEVAEFDLLRLLFFNREEDLQKTRWQQPALFTMEYAMARYLMAMGIRPRVMAGHSLGELTALCLAGVYSFEDGFRIVNRRAVCMDKACNMNVDPGAMLAVDAPLSILKEKIAKWDRVYITNINSPHQLVAGGDTEQIKALGGDLKAGGYRNNLLRVSMAFHSPIMACIHDELEAFIGDIEFHAPKIPVISNTTMKPFPEDTGEIKRIVMAHLESPVHWMENVRTMWNDFGVRLFVEIGPRETLTNLISETVLEARCLPTCLPSAEAEMFRNAAARLYVKGLFNPPEPVPYIFPGTGAYSILRAPIPASPAIPFSSAPKSTHACGEETLEAVILIIMEQTGHERDEIDADMDLREDLFIRSSRLPVIMEALQTHFAIRIDTRDFPAVRTVRDVADRISEIMLQGRRKDAEMPAAQTAPSRVAPSADWDGNSLKRLIFKEVPLDKTQVRPVELTPMDTVAVLTPTVGTDLCKGVGNVLRRDYGAQTLPFTYLGGPDPERGASDLRTADGVALVKNSLAGIESLAGLVFIVDEVTDRTLESAGDPIALLTGFFAVVKCFLESPAKKFAMLLHKGGAPGGCGRLETEGMVGLFLSAALEFPNVRFRVMGMDERAHVRDAVRACLDRNRKPVRLFFSRNEVLTEEGYVNPCRFPAGTGLMLAKEDVLLFSGGCSGILPYLAKGFAPIGCKTVFLGRTAFNASEPDPTGKAAHIAKALKELHELGIPAIYRQCDVNDCARTAEVVGKIEEEWGPITGIIHGAGLLADNLISRMGADDFETVVKVKMKGAWNLFHAAQNNRLKFFISLSSAAAIQGNPGQANYTAANRMMSALMENLHEEFKAVRFKALMLPPIAGAGMAEKPEVRAMMNLMNASYVHGNELAALVCRELFAGESEEVRVMFMRSLPDMPSAPLSVKDTVPPDEVHCAAVTFPKERFPMIDEAAKVDVRTGRITVSRTFDRSADLWIDDHKPFKFIEHPLISAVMTMETFLEAAVLLYPYLQPRGVRHVQLLDIIACPPATTRPCEITCITGSVRGDEIVCHVELSAAEASSGPMLEKPVSKYCAQVVLGCSPGRPRDLPGFPVRLNELDSRPMENPEVRKWYTDRTDMGDRYRVLERLDGTGPQSVRGKTVYREASDFKDPRLTNYAYSPYLLEALMQVVNFYIIMRDPSEKRSMIPHKIGEMIFARKCSTGEELILEARMVDRDERGITWNARALDQSGAVVMTVENLRMVWFHI
ncbi:MAG: SDR family NAD(P)-dependent oxidoreductase, partial [Syntrophales bacterium]|nr:SDR family NAD(P)-dependent oxidoreductase [Syntrophales bacterium]